MIQTHTLLYNHHSLWNYLHIHQKYLHHIKTYEYDDNGEYETWNGRRCNKVFKDSTTYKPNEFDILEYMYELPEDLQKQFHATVSPKLYTFDIETMVVDDEFPEPSEAKFPITTISIANPNCDVIILGTRLLDEVGQKYLSDEFSKYVKDTAFFHTLGLKLPTIKYVYFESEEAMLKYFLKNIVSLCR